MREPAPSDGSSLDRARVVLALVAVQVAFGTLPVAGKLAMQAVEPMALALLRVAGASLVFGLLAFGPRGRAAGRQPVFPSPTWPDVLRIAGCGLLGMAANQVLFLGGLERTTAANATVLVTTIPVFTFMVAVWARKERFTARGALGVALALGGVLTLVEVERFDATRAGLVGDAMIVLNALAYAAFLVLVRPLATRYGTMRVIAIAFFASTLVVAPLAAPALPSALARADAGVWGVVLYVVAVPTVLSYLLNMWALRRAPSSTVAVFIYLQPIVGLALAALILDEAVGPRAAAGTAAIFAGVWLVVRRARGAARPAAR